MREEKGKTKPLTIEELMYPASALPDIKRRAIKEFAERLKRVIIKGDGDNEFTRGYNCACDSHCETIDELVREYEE